MGSCNRPSASRATRFTPTSTGSSAPESMPAGPCPFRVVAACIGTSSLHRSPQAGHPSPDSGLLPPAAQRAFVTAVRLIAAPLGAEQPGGRGAGFFWGGGGGGGGGEEGDLVWWLWVG